MMDCDGALSGLVSLACPRGVHSGCIIAAVLCGLQLNSLSLSCTTLTVLPETIGLRNAVSCNGHVSCSFWFVYGV